MSFVDLKIYDEKELLKRLFDYTRLDYNKDVYYIMFSKHSLTYKADNLVVTFYLVYNQLLIFVESNGTKTH